MKDLRIRLLLAPVRAKNWQLRYNAACCYSRLLTVTDADDRDGPYSRAMRQLDSAYREADGDLDLDWIESDPDLDPLRLHSPGPKVRLKYPAWARRRKPPEPVTPPPEPTGVEGRPDS